MLYVDTLFASEQAVLSVQTDSFCPGYVIYYVWKSVWEQQLHVRLTASGVHVLYLQKPVFTSWKQIYTIIPNLKYVIEKIIKFGFSPSKMISQYVGKKGNGREGKKIKEEYNGREWNLREGNGRDRNEYN